DDHEHPLRLAVGLLGHDLLDQLVERLDPVLGRAPVKQSGATNVPRGEIAERAFAFVLVLDQLPITAREGGLGGMLARAGLDRRLLITADHEIAGLKQLALPAALVEIEDPASLL